MSVAVFRAMALGLVRDRGALAMSFILPVIVFLIFASIFAGATGEDLRLDFAVSDGIRSDTSKRLIAALEADSTLRRVGGDSLSADEVRNKVRRGTVDVGLVLREGTTLDSLGGFGETPILILSDPARAVAVSVAAGQIQKAYFDALPDVALAGVVELLENEFLELDDAQRRDVEEGLDGLRRDTVAAIEAGQATGWGFQDLFEREDVAGRSSNHVAYYAGAIAVLFLLFSAVHGAVTLLEEGESGIVDRILAGPGDVGVLVRGKFLFLTAQGFVQISVIFLFAWLVHGVDLPGHLGTWTVTTLAASAMAAGAALALAAACRTRRQAQTLANVAILVLSALGGSMVPRFLMPELIQRAGWVTPNTWALEAYTSIFWRGEPFTALFLPWAILFGAALLGVALASRFARRMETL